MQGLQRWCVNSIQCTCTWYDLILESPAHKHYTYIHVLVYNNLPFYSSGRTGKIALFLFARLIFMSYSPFSSFCLSVGVGYWQSSPSVHQEGGDRRHAYWGRMGPCSRCVWILTNFSKIFEKWLFNDIKSPNDTRPFCKITLVEYFGIIIVLGGSVFVDFMGYSYPFTFFLIHLSMTWGEGVKIKWWRIFSIK